MKILVIEDDSNIIDSLSIALKMRWPEAELVSTHLGEVGLRMVEQQQLDIVVLDLGLPDITGFEVLRDIRMFSEVPIIILSVRGDESDIVKGLEWGADDYIVKPFKQMEFIARVKALIRRKNIPSVEASFNRGPYKISMSAHKIFYRNKEIVLTGSECIIFNLLLKNANRIVTYRSISNALWGEEYPGSVEAIRVYVQRLRGKVEADTHLHNAITTKVGLGYVLNLEE